MYISFVEERKEIISLRFIVKKEKKLTPEFIFDELPKEMACVSFKYRIIDRLGNILKEYPMEYWAGFIGLKQNHTNYNLRPEIGWMVAYQDDSEKIKLEGNAEDTSESKRFFNIEKFPQEMFEASDEEGWRQFELNFKVPIVIPDHFSEITISHLFINGNINQEQKEKMMLLKPEGTMVWLNGKEME